MVLNDPEAVVVHVAQIYFGRGVAAARSLVKKAQRFGVVLLYPTTFKVEDTEVIRGRRVASIHGFLQPVQSGAGVRRRAPAGQ